MQIQAIYRTQRSNAWIESLQYYEDLICCTKTRHKRVKLQKMYQVQGVYSHIL